ncbi:hypothetical protein QJQ45_005167 [Haematococcus lacustris]|nr:hypothetical protein QJQ45_005167 [Haematococcus lacustris]
MLRLGLRALLPGRTWLASQQPTLIDAFSTQPLPSHQPNVATQGMPQELVALQQLPAELRASIPRVLIQDPWFSVDGVERTRKTAKLCLEMLRRTPQCTMSAVQVQSALNSQKSTALPEVTLATATYLLEHLRNKRLIVGRKNPATNYPAGHPKYEYLYAASPFQVMFKGRPSRVEAALLARQEAVVEQGLKRLRRGKAPYPIHRVQARSSAYHQALAYEAMAQVAPRSQVALLQSRPTRV